VTPHENPGRIQRTDDASDAPAGGNDEAQKE